MITVRSTRCHLARCGQTKQCPRSSVHYCDVNHQHTIAATSITPTMAKQRYYADDRHNHNKEPAARTPYSSIQRNAIPSRLMVDRVLCGGIYPLHGGQNPPGSEVYSRRSRHRVTNCCMYAHTTLTSSTGKWAFSNRYIPRVTNLIPSTSLTYASDGTKS